MFFCEAQAVKFCELVKFKPLGSVARLNAKEQLKETNSVFFPPCSPATAGNLQKWRAKNDQQPGSQWRAYRVRTGSKASQRYWESQELGLFKGNPSEFVTFSSCEASRTFFLSVPADLLKLSRYRLPAHTHKNRQWCWQYNESALPPFATKYADVCTLFRLYCTKWETF